MGFAVWAGDEVVWAAGTHEYRPMGIAVIARSDLFRAGDFRAGRRPPDRNAVFAGYFASLGDVNAFLAAHRRRPIERSQWNILDSPT